MRWVCSGSSKFYFSLATNKTDPDDGNQALVAYDISKQAVVSQVAWSAAHGSLNALVAATLPGAGGESVLALATDPHEHAVRPLELISIGAPRLIVTAHDGALVWATLHPLIDWTIQRCRCYCRCC